MFQVGSDWNPKQAQLKDIIFKPDKFNEAIELCLTLHSIVHSADVFPKEHQTFFDEIWDGLTKDAFITMPTKKDVTVAWNIWHITRIEDITANILIEDSKQVLTSEWLEKLNVAVRDTGNAMNDDEILALSQSINMEELRNYRNAVGIRTRDIIKKLEPSDIRQKVKPESVARILADGGVTKHKDSVWLLDFWGRKNIAGILLMPITRHQIGHLNDSMKLKKKIMKSL